MNVEIVEISSLISAEIAKTIYVVRLTHRICIHMDYYQEKVHDFGAYESHDMALAVMNAIKDGKIKVAIDL